MMRVIQIIGLGVGLVCGAAALAGEPAGTINAKTLGIAEAVMGYCQKADPADIGKYMEVVKQMVSGQSENAIAAVRESDEYRQAYDSIVDYVSKVDEHKGKALCADSATDK